MLLAALALFCVVGFASLLGAPAGDNPSDIFTDITVKDKPILLRNNVGQDKPWVGLQLKGTKSNRDGIGAKLALQAGGRCMVRWVTGGGSYLSSQDRRVLFGLGAGPAPKEVNLEIHWPSGQIQKVTGLRTNRYHVIQEPAVIQ